MPGEPHQQTRKRKIARCSGTAGASIGAAQPAQQQQQQQPSPDVNILVKRLRRLEEENAHLRARVVTSESNVHIMAEHLAARPAVAAVPQRQYQQRHRSHRRRPANIQLSADPAIEKAQGPRAAPQPPSPRLVSDAVDDAHAAGAAAAAASAVARGERGACRQRITSPRQFYLTLLAMYCSAFAHVMHGPNSKRPILSRAETQYEAAFQAQAAATTTTTKNDSRRIFASASAQRHGTASAEADMGAAALAASATGKKYERMLRASSHGLLRLIQFRRKIVRDRERSRRAALAGSAPSKLAHSQTTHGPGWQ